MSIDTAIKNIGEYYSAHYLDTTFAKDILDYKKKWNEEGSRSVLAKVSGLSDLYFKAKSQALEEENIKKRFESRETQNDLGAFHYQFLEALGYNNLEHTDNRFDDKRIIPTLGKVSRYDKPWLWVCETAFCWPETSLKEGMPEETPLDIPVYIGQLAIAAEAKGFFTPENWTKAITYIFKQEEPPRWVMLLGGSTVLLLDKNTFAQGRYLAFDLDDIYGRKVKAVFECLAAFLSHETLCPDGESADVLHDKLEENSHKFAHGVSEKLQFAVREAIELISNEWVSSRRKQKKGIARLNPKETQDEEGLIVTAEQLRHESLIFVYRLLFCFYAEARGGELDVLPMKDEIYRLGYSLESLRDLENVPLTAVTMEGYYCHEHLNRLFTLIHQGFQPDTSIKFGDSVQNFSLKPLTATLFAPEATVLLNKARLTNNCVQSVIRKLSLSVDDKNKSIGRVNYAELGINQLGAVYEGLLSYKGMFADQDLIQVKPKDKEITDTKTPSWFVPTSRIEDFHQDEIVREAVSFEKKGAKAVGKPKIYPRGSFILHLGGLEREQSASYYTPEVLTQCLVEEALRELLKDYVPADADKILSLKLCEPAMGSGAFLNEAASQLGHRYLELKQKQINKQIEPSEYPDEHRRVKHYIATRNIYGVDLNPTAVEFGALSLWLASMHRLKQTEETNTQKATYQVGATPWFGFRLQAGNSLIGARRMVWKVAELQKGLHTGDKGIAPRLLKPGEARADNEIYHFLIFDENMASAASDKLIKEYYLEDSKKVQAWLNKQVKPKWDTVDLETALQLSDYIDKHWQIYSEQREKALNDTACTATVWPILSSSKDATKESPSLQDQEKSKTNLQASSGSYQRLKMVMDTWCALWFWPTEKADALPSRDGWLQSVNILMGLEPIPENERALFSEGLGFDINVLYQASKTDLPDTETICSTVPWFEESATISQEQNFHHWPLAFSEILGQNATHKGFDLILGNPPWARANWSDETILYEMEPLLGVREAKSEAISNKKKQLLSINNNYQLFKHGFESVHGLSTYLGAPNCYSELQGQRTNLYKNFIVISWALLSDNGIGGLLHPEGVYDDPNSGDLRRNYYKRLVAHFQLVNELKLFNEVAHTQKFSLNIFSGKSNRISFKNLVNIYYPITINLCTVNNGNGVVPGLKNSENNWEQRGHKNRIIQITENELKIFAKLFEEPDTPFEEARLPQVHSVELIEVLSKIINTATKLSDLKDTYQATQVFNETADQKNGNITRQDDPSFQPTCAEDWVLSGPHFFVATPFASTPRSVCTDKSHFDEIDITTIPENYLPNAVYRPGDEAGSLINFKSKVSSEDSYINQYRLANRKMCQPSAERSLITTIIPKGASVINSVLLTGFKTEELLLNYTGITISVPIDFLIRISGRTNVYVSTLEQIPYIKDDRILIRVLRLTCLTKSYSELWENNYNEKIKDSWASQNEILKNDEEVKWESLSKKFKSNYGFRTDYARRQAILEIDVLVAQRLNLKVDELLTIYRIQFAVMRAYELADEYDQKGRHIPNSVIKNQGSKEFSAAYEKRQAEIAEGKATATDPLVVSWEIDNGLKSVTKTYYPPFFHVDREEDYRIAWQEFEKRSKESND